MTKEIWKDIPGYEKIYQVSNLARVRSFAIPHLQKPKGPRILSQATNRKTGHKWVSLFKNGKAYRPGVHRVMMMAFKPQSDMSLLVCHLNGVSDDNRLDNLMWGTHSINNHHTLEHGTRMRGSKHHKAKINEQDALDIKKMIAAGTKNRDIANQYPISENMVSKIRHGKAWGYIE